MAGALGVASAGWEEAEQATAALLDDRRAIARLDARDEAQPAVHSEESCERLQGLQEHIRIAEVEEEVDLPRQGKPAISV